MRFVSPTKPSLSFSLHDAVFGTEGNRGVLFFPKDVPVLPIPVINNLSEMTIPEIGYIVMGALLGKEIPLGVVKNVVNDTLNFELPVNEVDNNIFEVDFSKGPTGSKYDFSALPFSRILNYCSKGFSPQHKLNIIAPGIYGNGVALAKALSPFSNINLLVLYPYTDRNNPNRLLSLFNGSGIEAILVKNSLADVYKVMDQLFDRTFNDGTEIVKGDISNIAFLLPLTVPLFAIFSQIKRKHKEIKSLKLVASTLTFDLYLAAQIAKQMGLPVECILSDFDSENNISTEHLSRMSLLMPNSNGEITFVNHKTALGLATKTAPVVDITSAGHIKFKYPQTLSTKKPKIHTNINSLLRLLNS